MRRVSRAAREREKRLAREEFIVAARARRAMARRLREIHVLPTSRSQPMLRYAAIFLVIALIAAVLGFTGIAAGAAEIAKILFFLFIVIALVTLVIGLIRRT
jgi:uncharacterized membrane protein YtjA (UPF0391 family)